jgi:DNA-binding transcriptional LysR family regulator
MERNRKERRLRSPAFDYFVAVAHEGSFQGAGRLLRIAPSAINRHVLLLEEDLGFALFDRGGRGLRLTNAGQILLRHCDATVRGFTYVLEELDALRDLRTGAVRVAASESFAAEIVPEVCAEFSAAYPSIRVDVTVPGSGVDASAVAEDEADVGLTFVDDIPGDGPVAVWRLPIGAVVGPMHPLADRRSISIRECFAYPLVIPDVKLSFGRRLREATDLFSDGPSGGVAASSPRLSIGIARMGVHVAFQTKVGLARDLEAGSLVFVPLQDRALRPDVAALIRSPRSTGRFAVEAFCKFAAETVAKKLFAIGLQA